MEGSRAPIEEKFFHLCQRVVEDNALELYHLEYRGGQGLLRVMIQDPETRGASIEHCVQIDRALSPFIAQEEWIPEKLTLEVSSPGLNRPLQTEKHFQQSIGERIAIKLNAPYDCNGAIESYRGQRHLVGVLTGLGEDCIQIAVEGGELSIPRNTITRARREPLL